jgi:Kdo2-lipid IVA lauroyltransferase/acyltransferase
MYRSLGAGVLELLWLAGRSRPALDRIVTLDDEALVALERAQSRGRGMVVAASHTGNWDLAACAVAARVPLLVVTKRLSVRALDVFWQTTRARFGVGLASAEAALGRGRSHLARGGAVAMMIDQVPLRTRHGVCGDFLGDRAWIDKAPATLAARTGAPLVVSAARRTATGHHVVSALCVLEPPEDAGRAWIESATREATAALDAFVRRHPEAWLWMHRRWKAPAL